MPFKTSPPELLRLLVSLPPLVRLPTLRPFQEPLSPHAL
jgi:hypothetical protein